MSNLNESNDFAHMDYHPARWDHFSMRCPVEALSLSPNTPLYTCKNLMPMASSFGKMECSSLKYVSTQTYSMRSIILG